MKPQRTIVTCPNCGKEGVEALHYPSYLGHHTSRISAGSKTKFYREPDCYEMIGGCSKCGKTLEELREIEKRGRLTHEERIRRMKEAGIPTRIECPVR